MGPWRPRPRGFGSQVVVCRAVAVAALALCALHARELDALVARFWEVLRAQAWFRLDSFEPMLSTCCFFVYIGGFAVLDNVLMPAFPVLRGYRIQARDDESAWRHHGRIRGEMLSYVVPLLTLDYFFPRRALPEAPPTAARVVWELFACLFLYDLLFTALHVAWHRVPWLYRCVHAEHHRHTTTRAGDAVRHTVVDGTGDVLCSILALNLARAHPLSRALYDATITYLLTELHSGTDLPWSLANLVPGVFAGPRRHDEHHRVGNAFYGKFFVWTDDALGLTAEKDRARVSAWLAAAC